MCERSISIRFPIKKTQEYCSVESLEFVRRELFKRSLRTSFRLYFSIRTTLRVAITSKSNRLKQKNSCKLSLIDVIQSFRVELDTCKFNKSFVDLTSNCALTTQRKFVQRRETFLQFVVIVK